MHRSISLIATLISCTAINCNATLSRIHNTTDIIPHIHNHQIKNNARYYARYSRSSAIQFLRFASETFSILFSRIEISVKTIPRLIVQADRCVIHYSFSLRDEHLTSIRIMFHQLSPNSDLRVDMYYECDNEKKIINDSCDQCGLLHFDF